MAAGKLKKWNADRGFGFIVDDSGAGYVFARQRTEVCGNRSDRIKVGDRLTFDTANTRDGKMKPATFVSRDMRRLVEFGLKVKK